MPNATLGSSGSGPSLNGVSPTVDLNFLTGTYTVNGSAATLSSVLGSGLTTDTGGLVCDGSKNISFTGAALTAIQANGVHVVEIDGTYNFTNNGNPQTFLTLSGGSITSAAGIGLGFPVDTRTSTQTDIALFYTVWFDPPHTVIQSTISSTGGPYRAVLSANGTTYKAVADGGSVSSQTSSTARSSIQICGSAGTSGFRFIGRIRRYMFFPTTTATDTDLSTLSNPGVTTVGASPATPNEQNDTLSSSATVSSPISATLDKTMDQDTLGSAAQLALSASLSRTEQADTLAASAMVEVRASLSKTETNDTLSSASTLAISASTSGNEAGDTLAAASTLLSTEINCTFNVTEADDALSSASGLAITATASGEESDDTLSSGYLIGGNTADFAGVEENDTLGAATTVSISASLTVSEQDDTLDAVGDLAAAGALAATEDDDTVISEATLLIGGSLASQELNDTLISSIKLGVVWDGDGVGGGVPFTVPGASFDFTVPAPASPFAIPASAGQFRVPARTSNFVQPAR